MEKIKGKTSKEKKAYEKPQIVYQQCLEVIAAECPGPSGKEPCTVNQS